MTLAGPGILRRDNANGPLGAMAGVRLSRGKIGELFGECNIHRNGHRL